MSAGLTPDLQRSLGEAGCRVIPLAPAAEAQSQQQVLVNTLQAEQTRLTEEVSKDPQNTAFKTALDNVTAQLESARSDLVAMEKRSKP